MSLKLLAMQKEYFKRNKTERERNVRFYYFDDNEPIYSILVIVMYGFYGNI